MIGLSPLAMLPPIVLPSTLVYSITSSPIKRYPVFVVPTLTFSKVENPVASSTERPDVELEVYAAVNFVGLTSGRTPAITTLLSGKYIPWF